MPFRASVCIPSTPPTEDPANTLCVEEHVRVATTTYCEGITLLPLLLLLDRRYKDAVF